MFVRDRATLAGEGGHLARRPEAARNPAQRQYTALPAYTAPARQFSHTAEREKRAMIAVGSGSFERRNRAGRDGRRGPSSLWGRNPPRGAGRAALPHSSTAIPRQLLMERLSARYAARRFSASSFSRATFAQLCHRGRGPGCRTADGRIPSPSACGGSAPANPTASACRCESKPGNRHARSR